MFDLHSHIIPGIDDGAKDMEMSVSMLKIAVENGTEGIVATPHAIEGEWLPAWERILTECDNVEKAAQEAGIQLPIFPGAEIGISLDILDCLKAPGPYCINSGRYLLVELPASHIPGFTDEFFFTLQARDITPILAHPERHPELAKRPKILMEWINRGVLTQMNGTSLTGQMGKRVMATAELLLVSHMIYAVGSDAHRVQHRNTNLTAAVKKIEDLVGKEHAHNILQVNPERILYSKDVDILPVDKIKYPAKKRGVLKMLGNLWR